MADTEPLNAAPARPPRPGQRDLTTGPIAMTLLLFALPTLGGNILQTLNGTINTIWVGNMLGEAAVAATANANVVLFLGFAAVFGLAMATTILIGQAIGAGDIDQARRTVGASVGLIVMIALMTAVAGYIFTPALLRALSTPAPVLPLAVAYLRVIFLGMPFIFMTVLLSSALRGAGDAITPLRAMVLNVVLDAGLNPFFIKGWLFFPELGIAGSALATLIAGFATTVYLVALIYAKDLPLRLRGAELSYLFHGRKIIAKIVGIGVPMGLTMVVLSASALAMMGLVNRSGVDTAAAFGAISQLWNYIQMPALALGAGVSAMVAQNIGAGRWDRVGSIAWAGSWMNTVLTASMVLLVFLVERPLLGLFLTPESPAVDIAIRVHTIASWGFILFGVSLVLTSVVRANGAVIAPLIILTIAFFPVRFGIAYYYEPIHGADAIWWSFPIGSLAALLMTMAYYRWGKWRAGQVLSAPMAATHG